MLGGRATALPGPGPRQAGPTDILPDPLPPQPTVRILIQTLGSSGDVLPFVTLGRALAARGHDVRVWANAAFRDRVEAAGLVWREAGSAAAFCAAQEDPDLWHPRKGVGVVLRKGVVPSLEPVVRALRAEVEPGRTLLVSGSLGFAARVVGEATHTPHATVHLAPSVYRSLRRLPRLGATTSLDRWPRPFKRFFWWIADRVIDPHVAPELARVRALLGLGPVRRVFDRWCHSPDLCLGLWPDWFAPPPGDWPPQARQVGFVLPDPPAPPHALVPGLADWLDEGEPPVVVTGGSANVRAGALCRAAAATALAIGRRVVCVTQSPEVGRLGPPARARVVPYAPFGWLFERAQALVSHGGIGTTAEALAAGLPHFVAAFAFDQFDNGSRLVDLGVGDVVAATRLDRPGSRRRLEALLTDPEVARRARALAPRVRADAGLARAVEALEALGPAPRLGPPAARVP